ncbi:MAG: Hsp20/alpha crystallin family protein [Nitrososphaerales archaeon]|nr:Hsp20/alpha crystallin family protein [Nitrososphaerales archaeon]
MSENNDDEGMPGRRRRGFPFGNWPFSDIDDMMRQMERAFSEQFKEMEKELPKNLVRERRLPDGSTKKEIGPIVYGYSVTVGPDGKPVVREFGNVRRGEGRPWKEIQDKREPLVDVVTSEKDVKVIAEIPGVRKEDVNVMVQDKTVTISVDTENRKYFKELILPDVVDPQGAKSTYNNGILEITLPLKSKGGRGVNLKVD